MPISVKDSQVSVRLPTGLKDQMETYAQLTGRTKSYVAMEALTEYLAWRIPQIEDLKQAIAAADNGDFAADAEVQAVFARYAAGKPPAAKRTSPSRRAQPAKRK
jgi:predicted transcriptional regulator